MDKPIIRIHASSFEDKDLTATIDFPITKERMNDAFRRLGIDDKDEGAISFDDIECPVDGIFDVIHPEGSFEDINRLALALERMSDKDRQKLSAAILTPDVIRVTGEAMHIKKAVKIAERLNAERALPDTPGGKNATNRPKRRDMDAR